MSQYIPSEYERIAYYNGIAEDDHPVLVYRSDYATNPFPTPTGRYGHIPVKSARGVHDTALNPVWDSVAPEIVELITMEKIACSSVGAVRFFTHPTEEARDEGRLGPVVVWLGVDPGSTSPDAAHEISQRILALLGKYGVNDAVVEWREAVLQRLGGPPLMAHADSADFTHHVRRFLTALLGIPLATQGMEKDDAQGTLTLWFHENKDMNGNPSDKVYGVSNCHVLRKNSNIDYEHKGGAPKDYVRVCGVRRFQRGLDEIKAALSVHAVLATAYTELIDKMEKQENSNRAIIAKNRRLLDDENEAIRELDALHKEASKYWSDITLHRDIGYVQHAKAIKVDVDGGTRYTSDWGAFLAIEAKVRDQFEGNVVDIGSKFNPQQLMSLFYPRGGGVTTFKYSLDRKVRIVGCCTKEELDNPTEFNSEGKRIFTVAKDGNSTDFTVGQYAGLVTWIRNLTGNWSKELAIYNHDLRKADVFSDRGDSGSLFWRAKDGQGYIVGQLHAGDNKGGVSRNHVSYCTPGWYLLEQIKERFPDADFYRTAW
ncbi:hypothetical protein FA95DRAFT_1216494 [Auriscalpium vulgare]|uniref:Uncharacterized protein n=1 Tax=Auriscalpium vulgare TaxID=40419 RepID=A0ACB8R408_9AGAM|nr:hypothetical protein FA95DRAFT_1216494 [Auriscalpium vulgare]